MDSNTLNNFSGWFSLDNQGIGQAPREQGVYVIRKKGGITFGRLKGVSDILYIGHTVEKRGGLKERLKKYLRPGKDQLTNICINKLLEKYEMEVAWCTSNEPSNLET